MGAKANGKARKKILPKSRNGTKRKSVYFPAYQGQKDELRTEANKKGVSVSYLLNMKHFKDWF